jgi:hypothetical protein
LLLCLEQTRRAALEDYVHRPPPMGPGVLISESWYKAMTRNGLLTGDIPLDWTDQERLLGCAARRQPQH